MPIPLSPQQRLIWLQEHQAPRPGLFNVPLVCSMEGVLHPVSLRRALADVVCRHDALCLRLLERKGHPVQEVVEAPTLDFAVVDCLGESEATLLRRLPELAAEPLDLARGAPIRFRLFRLAPAHSLLCVIAHHLVWDAVSEGVFLHDLTAALDGRLPHAAAPGSFLDSVSRLQERMRARRTEEAWARVEAELRGADPGSGDALAAARTDVDRFAAVLHRARLDSATLEQVARVAQAARVTPYMLLLCTFRVLMAKTIRANDLLVATPMSLRSDAQSLATIGYLTNITVVRNRIRPADSFRETLARERAAVLAAMARRELPLPDVMAASGMAGVHTNVATCLSYDRHDGAPLASGQVRLRSLPLTLGIAQFDIAVDIVADELGMQCLWVLRACRFDESDASRFAERYAWLLDQVLTDPDRSVADLDVAHPHDRAAIAKNHGRVSQISETALDMILDWASRTPDAPAVTSGGRTLTYAELIGTAKHVARVLLSHPFPAESGVALLMERSPLIPAALIGIALAGLSVVPLDPTHAPERLSAVLHHAGIVAAIVGETPPPVPLGDILVVHAGERTASADSWQPRRPTPDGLAYVLYTSGSTGSPKGVAIRHGAVANCLAASRVLFACKPGDVLVSATTISFDIASFEILLPLVSGGHLVLADGDPRDGQKLRELMERYRPRFFHGTPALWKLLFAAGWTGQDDLVAMVGGDMVPPDLARRIQDATAEIWHLYGPTETTLFTLAERLDGSIGTVLTVGHPLPNTSAHVLDEKLQPCLPGTVGELYVGGAGVARGYIRMGPPTAERFVPDPYAVERGARLYRTGDLARMTTDGRIQILGRSDRQVKIRGFRIEPEEIERTLAQVEGIADCAVIVLDRYSDRARLVACLERVAGGRHSERSLREQVLAEAARRLPRYMVPSLLLFYDVLPVSPNGKTDRARLMRDALEGIRPAASEARHADSLDDLVAGIWSEVLGGVQIGREHDFFVLGGDSISATLAAALLQKAAGVQIDPICFFIKPRFADFMGEVRREVERDRRLAALMSGHATQGTGEDVDDDRRHRG